MFAANAALGKIKIFYAIWRQVAKLLNEPTTTADDGNRYAVNH